MSARAQIYWSTELSPVEAARVIADAVPDAALRWQDGHDVPIVTLQGPGQARWIGGPVSANYLAGIPLDGEAPEDPG